MYKFTLNIYGKRKGAVADVCCTYTREYYAPDLVRAMDVMSNDFDTVIQIRSASVRPSDFIRKVNLN
jgi:hypothetical protein